MFFIEARVPIECKHRLNVEWFAFDVPRSSTQFGMNPLRPPVFSEPMGFEFAASTADWSQIDLPERRLTAIETKGFTLSNDTLLKEVAAAAFDYAAAHRATRNLMLPPDAAWAMRDMGILQRFQRFDATNEQPMAQFVATFKRVTDVKILEFCETLSIDVCGTRCGSRPHGRRS